MSALSAVRQLEPEECAALLPSFCRVLADCVNGGAGVSFMLPFSEADAAAWWPGPFASAARGERLIFGAFVDGVLEGTVQLVTSTPPNQPHRADIAKMLVHRRARRHGLGAALMLAAENAARRMGKSLLCLDTVTGSAGERLYARLGWVTAGVIPHYAFSPDGGHDDATFMWKAL